MDVPARPTGMGLEPRGLRCSARHAAEFPATLAQEREYRLSGPDRIANINHVVAFHVSGPFAPDVAQRASDELVRRHAALRTCLRERGPGVRQVVAELETVPIATCDAASAPADQRERRADDFLWTLLGAPFELERPPLFRVGLARTGPEAHRIFWVFAHTIIDGATLGTFRAEFLTLYAALANGAPPEPPASGLELAELAAWEHTVDDEVARAYWHAHLREASPETSVPIDRRQRLVREHRPRRIDAPAVRAVTPVLRRLGRLGGASTGVAAVTAVASVLHEYADGPRVNLSVTHANRDRPRAERTLGRLVDVVPLSLDFTDRPTFVDRVEHVGAAMRAARAHRLPGGRLLDLLPYPSELAVNVVRYPVPETVTVVVADGDQVRFAETHRWLGTSFHTGNGEWYGPEIIVSLWLQDDETVTGHVRFNAELVTARTAERLGGDVAELLVSLRDGH